MTRVITILETHAPRNALQKLPLHHHVPAGREHHALSRQHTILEGPAVLQLPILVQTPRAREGTSREHPLIHLLAILSVQHAVPVRHAVLALALIVHAPRLLLCRRRHQVQLLLLRQVRRGHSRLLLLDGLVVKDALPHHQPQRAVPHGVALHAPAAEAAHHHLALARVVHATPAERAVAPLALVLQLVLRVVQSPETLRPAARHLALIV